MRARISTLFLGIALALNAAACGAPDAKDVKAQLVPIAAARGGSLVVDARRYVAWAADADNHAILALDLATGRVEATSIDGAPEQIALLGDDRIAVTVRDKNAVEVFDVKDGGALGEPKRVEVAIDPFGVAVSSRGEILVTSAYAHAITSIDAHTLETRFRLDVAREPRSVSIAADGSHAYVTHLVGDAVTVVDLHERKSGRPDARARQFHALGGRYRNRVDAAIGAGTLHPTAALAYASVLSPSGSRLFVPHITEQNGATTTRTIPGSYGGVPVEEETSFASVAVVTTTDERALGDTHARAPGETIDKQASIAANADFSVAPQPAPCRQARAVALAGDRLLVASQGTNEVIELDARAIDPAMAMRRRFAVGEGPKGIDVDPTGKAAIVFDQISHDFSIISLVSGAVERVRGLGDPLSPEVAAGRRLFTTERDRRISRDGRACAACHPEGRDDGVVWKLGAGPRQTPTLVGRLDHGPFGWLGKHAKLEDNMRETIGRLGGTGLSDSDLTNLAAFLRRGLARPNKPSANDPELLVARGHELFTSPSVGCSTCHKLDTEASDRAVHEIGSRTKDDTTAGFRTPPLLFVGSTAPYFHDGRYATLEQLLADNYDRMGNTTQLSQGDVKALAAYLRSL